MSNDQRTPELDAQGYPTEKTLSTIRGWRGSYLELMGYVNLAWWSPDWGWREIIVENDSGIAEIHYDISTGGWSGNESLISAMQDYSEFWREAWYSTRRGGHYGFRLKKAQLPNSSSP